MKRFFDFFSSSKATIILLVILAVAMALATFIEDRYDTTTAKNLVYNTIWFELLFILLALNLIAHIKTYNFFSISKIGSLIFHLAFILMIIGAGITRYFGFEGSMHIRKGKSSNIVYSNHSFLMISYSDKKNNYNHDYPINIGTVNKNVFRVNIPTETNDNINVKYKYLLCNAITKIEENVVDGENMIGLFIATTTGLQTMIIKNGEEKSLGVINLAYNNNKNKDAIKITGQGDILNIVSPYNFVQKKMIEDKADTIKKYTLTTFKEGFVYNINGVPFLYSKFYKNAQKRLVSGSSEDIGIDAIVLNVTIKGKKYQVNVFRSPNYTLEFENYNFNGRIIKFAFGNKPVELPFSLYLEDFIFEKYPGSESPSSYKSKVRLIDKRENINEKHSIYMNNVLDYNQYRFFQSSYDKDEQGTILSVSHDFWGTFVSYLGYILLSIGFLVTLFNKNSRFLSLRKSITDIRVKRKSMLLAITLLLGINGLVFSQSTINNVVNPTHANNFGHLLTQTYDGRFAPVHTLALDLMQKVSKKVKFDIEGKGKMDAMQVFISMMAEPEFWQQQKIIYVPLQAVKNIIGIQTDFASFSDFFDTNSQYKLDKYINEAFRKKQSEKNKFDKEILKVDERLNIFYMIINGSLLKIFPEQTSKNNKWISWNDKSSMFLLTGSVSAINKDLQLKNFNYANIMQAYIFEVSIAIKTGNYTKANKIVSYISTIQKQNSNPVLLPSETKIKAEIFYNNANIFILLKNVYAILSLLLLILAFIENIKSQKSKFIAYALNGLSIILGMGFLYHSLGMGLRWYITGHAPWSNGYEALILVAWGALLAGFSFVKSSKLTLAATTLLAFFVLMTASHSSYDPQLTNLQPVLKSYWLIIHVATLTISYGFLGLGFVLGLINMCIYLFKTKKNNTHLDLLIAENTYIIEMNLIIGLVLATLGTFLGAVWANESWGRYWGWDAKETWALIIIITYSIVLHLRFIPKLNNKYIFNVASIISFASVIMTFVGVNYYLSKGMHSYGAGDKPVFPVWTWSIILSILILIIYVGKKEISNKNQINQL